MRSLITARYSAVTLLSGGWQGTASIGRREGLVIGCIFSAVLSVPLPPVPRPPGARRTLLDPSRHGLGLGGHVHRSGRPHLRRDVSAAVPVTSRTALGLKSCEATRRDNVVITPTVIKTIASSGSGYSGYPLGMVPGIRKRRITRHWGCRGCDLPGAYGAILLEIIFSA